MARPIRVAAAGDIHCSPESQRRLGSAFERLDDVVDLFLLAGDLTTLGEPEQAEALADVCRPLRTKVVAVLGNHDWHANRVDEVVSLLDDAHVTVLDPGWTTAACGRSTVSPPAPRSRRGRRARGRTGAPARTRRRTSAARGCSSRS